jgi:hypothetical protein
MRRRMPVINLKQVMFLCYLTVKQQSSISALILHNYTLRTPVYLMTSCSTIIIKTLMLFLRTRNVTTDTKTLDL